MLVKGQISCKEPANVGAKLAEFHLSWPGGDKGKTRVFFSIDFLSYFGFLSLVVDRYKLAANNQKVLEQVGKIPTFGVGARERQKLSSFRLTNGYRRGLSSIDFLLFPTHFLQFSLNKTKKARWEVDFFLN